MITVTLNSDEMRDVVYALKLAADDLQLRSGICARNGNLPRADAAMRVFNRVETVRHRIETIAAVAPVGGRCVHGIAFSVPCVKCTGVLKGE